jgi:hypothetical protein
VTASDARSELEAVIFRAFAGTPGRDRPMPGAAVDVILAAADRYRDAAPDGDGRVVHLTGAGGRPACRYRWLNPDALALTGNPAAVTCGRCRRSLRYRALAGGGDE